MPWDRPHSAARTTVAIFLALFATFSTSVTAAAAFTTASSSTRADATHDVNTDASSAAGSTAHSRVAEAVLRKPDPFRIGANVFDVIESRSETSR